MLVSDIDTPLARRLRAEDDTRARELACVLGRLRGRRDTKVGEVGDTVVDAIRAGAPSVEAVMAATGYERRRVRLAVNRALRLGRVIVRRRRLEVPR
jgi:ribosomal protein L14